MSTPSRAPSPPRGAVLRSVSVAVAAFALFGTVTGLVPNPVYVRMIDTTVADYAFLVATAAFAGAFVYQRSLVDESLVGDEYAAGGVVAGFLAFGCPICNAVLLALFSSSALMTHFDPLRPYLGVASVGLFVALLYAQHRRGCDSC